MFPPSVEPGCGALALRHAGTGGTSRAPRIASALALLVTLAACATGAERDVPVLHGAFGAAGKTLVVEGRVGERDGVAAEIAADDAPRLNANPHPDAAPLFYLSSSPRELHDDGEHDQRVYDDIRRRYPERIEAIWIRRVAPVRTPPWDGQLDLAGILVEQP